MRGVVCAVFLSAVAGAPALAAEPARFELFAFGGGAILEASRVQEAEELCGRSPGCEGFRAIRRLGPGVLGGLGVGYRLTPRLHASLTASATAPRRQLRRFEADVFVLPFEVETKLASYQYQASLRYDLTRAATRPYVAIGMARVEYGAYRNFGQRLSSASPPGDWTLTLAAGVSHRLSDRFDLRAELADAVALEHDLHARVGVVFRP